MIKIIKNILKNNLLLKKTIENNIIKYIILVYFLNIFKVNRFIIQNKNDYLLIHKEKLIQKILKNE